MLVDMHKTHIGVYLIIYSSQHCHSVNVVIELTKLFLIKLLLANVSTSFFLSMQTYVFLQFCIFFFDIWYIS